jgi:rhodanese-related sulfurtransferase
MSLPLLSPQQAKALVDGGAQLIDVRAADEHARAHIPGAQLHPLEHLVPGCLAGAPALIFYCRSGLRTSTQAERLTGAAAGSAYILDGGLEAWRRAGLPVREDRRQPLEIMRQVQLIAGSLVLLGVLLGLTLSPGFFGLSAFVGAGLMFAGASGWCGMAKLLAQMPWNRALTS